MIWKLILGRLTGFAWPLVCGVLMLLLLIFAPNVLVPVVVIYVLLRLWPDRLYGSVLVMVWLVPVWLVRTWPPSWWLSVYSWPDGQLSPEWLATGLLYGPWWGGLVWRVSQWFREHSKYSGRRAVEQRQRVEERRELYVTQLAHRLHFTSERPRVAQVAGWWRVRLGDGQGPYLGRLLRGDLGSDKLSRPWRAGRATGRLLGGQWVRLPVNTAAVDHAIILGGTGTGKSESIYTVAEWGMRNGFQVIYISNKQPSSERDAAAPRLAAQARREGLTVTTLTKDGAPFDPMAGTPEQLRDKLIAVNEWPVPYFRDVANVAIELVIQMRHMLGMPCTELAHITDSLVPVTFAKLAARTGDKIIQGKAESFRERDLQGTASSYQSLSAHLAGWTGPGWRWEHADVIVAELPTSSQPVAAAALLRVMVRDLGGYLRDRSRRPHHPDGTPVRKVLLVIEEMGSVSTDRPLGQELINLVERGRSAGLFTVVSSQAPEGLGDARAQQALMTNGATISFRQSPAAEQITALAGTRYTDEGSIAHDGGWLGTGGWTTLKETQKVSAQLLRELQRGELMVLSQGRYCTAAAGMQASGYDQTTTDQMPQVTHGMPAISAPTAPPSMLSAPVALPTAPEPAAVGRPGFTPAPGWQPLDGPRQ